MPPRVIIVRHTPDPEGVVAMAARLCYSPDSVEEVAASADASDNAGFIRRIVSLGHHSVMEHASFTFGVEGISRAASHQLVRHRLASYSQKSQRYVVEERPFDFVVPGTIAADPARKAEYEALMGTLHERYRELVAAGIPAEDARYVLPNAAETKLFITMNVRELRHFFQLRLCLRAQWEIRALAEAMLAEARPVAPLLFAGTGPSCVDGACPEGAMTCGRAAEVRRRYGAAR
jgi:thymidylate synthase (FAD)